SRGRGVFYGGASGVQCGNISGNNSVNQCFRQKSLVIRTPGSPSPLPSPSGGGRSRRTSSHSRTCSWFQCAPVMALGLPLNLTDPVGTRWNASLPGSGVSIRELPASLSSAFSRTLSLLLNILLTGVSAPGVRLSAPLVLSSIPVAIRFHLLLSIL